MKLAHHNSSSRGATAVEALVAFPLFFMVILAFIDISRYTFLVLGLRHAAQRTADYASKINIGADITHAACTADPPECVDEGCSAMVCAEYQARLADLEAFAMRYASLVSDPSATAGSSARRLRFNHYPAERYNLDSGPRNQVWNALASKMMEFAFIRPGEAVKLELAAEENLEIHHRVRPFGTGESQGWPDRVRGEDWAKILESQPIIIRFDVMFDAITPFFPDRRVSVEEYAYRKQKIYASGEPADPPPTLPPATPTITPTGTPPTPVPQPDPTGTPTATVAPPAHACDDYCNQNLAPPGACAQGGSRCYACRDCPDICPCPTPGGIIG